MPKIRILLRARLEAADIHDWYESQLAGLGQRFLARLDRCFDTITANPRLYAVTYRSYRLAGVKKFPYFVYYTVLGDLVTVHAVVYGSRDQNAILKSLP